VQLWLQLSESFLRNLDSKIQERMEYPDRLSSSSSTIQPSNEQLCSPPSAVVVVAGTAAEPVTDSVKVVSDALRENGDRPISPPLAPPVVVVAVESAGSSLLEGVASDPSNVVIVVAPAVEPPKSSAVGPVEHEQHASVSPVVSASLVLAGGLSKPSVRPKAPPPSVPDASVQGSEIFESPSVARKDMTAVKKIIRKSTNPPPPKKEDGDKIL
jgi:hypothetical protein